MFLWMLIPHPCLFNEKVLNFRMWVIACSLTFGSPMSNRLTWIGRCAACSVQKRRVYSSVMGRRARLILRFDYEVWSLSLKAMRHFECLEIGGTCRGLRFEMETCLVLQLLDYFLTVVIFRDFELVLVQIHRMGQGIECIKKMWELVM